MHQHYGSILGQLGYHTQSASPSYAGLSGTLAAIVLASLVLILQLPEVADNPSTTPRERGKQTGIISLSLLVSLFGCIVTTINYATLSGVTGTSSIIHLTSLAISSGFALSIITIFISFYLLSMRYFRPETSRAIWGICLVFGAGSLVFLNVNMFDYANFGRDSVLSLWWILPTLGISLSILVAAGFITYRLEYRDPYWRYILSIYSCVFLIVSSTMVALFMPQIPIFSSHGIHYAALTIVLQSIVIGSLLGTTPRLISDFANP